MATGNTGVKMKVTDTSIEGRNPKPNGSDSISSYAPKPQPMPGNVGYGDPKPDGKDSIKNNPSQKTA